MNIRVLLLLVSIVFLPSCATAPQCGDGTPEGQGRPPVILDSYAASVIRPGVSWRVYFQAKDDDGDMKDVAAIVTQTGVAPYPTGITPIKQEDAKELGGYLYLSTSGRDRNLIFDRLTLKLIVRDCQGNRSEPAEFHLRFDHGPSEKTPEKWEKFANSNLGPIMIDIEPSVPSRPFGGL